MEKIGLFPLNIVLFPHTAYPLHIFEERYKQLISESIANDLEFGITYMNGSKMFEIGCKAKVKDVLRQFGDGKMDIIVEGVERFIIKSVTDNPSSYHTAEIAEYNDRFHDLDDEALHACIDLYNEAATKIKIIHIPQIDKDNFHLEYPSFYIATKVGVGPEQKQILLELNSENKRIKYLLKHLKQLLPTITDKRQIDNIIKNDGYFKTNGG